MIKIQKSKLWRENQVKQDTDFHRYTQIILRKP